MNLTCKELVELVTDYFEGALPPPERLRFEQHLSGCQGCTVYVEQIRQAIFVTGKLLDDVIKPDEKQKLLAVFADWKKEQNKS